MVKVKEDLTGKIFGRLTVVKQVEDYILPCGKHHARWLCRCSCIDQKEVVVWGASLRRGDTTSCGCLGRENQIQSCKKYNEYRIEGDIVIGLTTNTNKEFYVDLKNFDKIKDYCWYEQKGGAGSLKTHIPKSQKIISMHQMLGFKNYDHIDRNELNNLESNLRPATYQENARNHSLLSNNTSGFTGVSWDKKMSKWRSYIVINKQQIHLGLYINKEDAVIARLKAEAKYYGEFAPQRHLFDEYGISINNKENMYSNE